MNKTVKFCIIVCVLLICIYGCFSYKNISRQNLAYLYNDADIVLKPEYKLFHHSEDTSVLYFRINTEELLYARDGFLGNFKAKYSIKCELLQNYESKSISDSVSFHYIDSVVVTSKRLLFDSLFLRIPDGKKYVLRLNAFDQNRTKSFVSFINVEKENKLSSQNFLVLDENGAVCFDSFIRDKQNFRIRYRNSTSSKLVVKHYKNNFPIATPPFHSQSGKSTTIYPDSVFEIKLVDTYTDLLVFPLEGIYRILSDTSFKEGVTLLRFHEDFPAITLPEQMLFSARYLTTRQEFDRMLIMADKKKAIEDFWLDIGGNSDRARQLIKLYYSRVQIANKFFTSYHEGWKTDRGMIYIIYGAPSTVYKTSSTENWIYGEASALKSINFIFYKMDNPFTENDYMMSKSELFRDSWYYAVSNWRR